MVPPCSFCGKNQEQGKLLIAGPGAVYICDECVELCRERSCSSPADIGLSLRRCGGDAAP